MSTFQSTVQGLASAFASSVLDAIRGASLEDLLGQAHGPTRRGPGRPKSSPATVTGAEVKPGRKTRSGRLKRRSPEQIASALGKVVSLLKKNRAGLRAEQIRKELAMQAKEMPRVLKEGVATKKLKFKGQKRATTYTAA